MPSELLTAKLSVIKLFVLEKKEIKRMASKEWFSESASD
jgi:hypothetical protein